ncbi:hypothetical protein Ae201684P_013084 [Aphanomyces euteiches]|nr:hypothetical protein Ae201684P_013084 [Aphanomyces euteiches]
MSNDWDMDLDDDFNQDLLGRPFDVNNALDAMMFPVSPLSKAGQRTLKYAQRSLQHEYEKKKNRRRTLDIFLEQFDNHDTPGEFDRMKMRKYSIKLHLQRNRDFRRSSRLCIQKGNLQLSFACHNCQQVDWSFQQN